MKNIIFIFSFLISINIYANTEDALCMNFARVLLGLEPGKHIVYVSINSYKSSKDVPPSKYNYRKAVQFYGLYNKKTYQFKQNYKNA